MAYLAVHGVPSEVEDLWWMVLRQGARDATALGFWVRSGNLETLLQQASDIGLMTCHESGKWESVDAGEAVRAARAWHERQAREADEALLAAAQAGVASGDLRVMVGMDEIRAYMYDAVRRCSRLLQGFDLPPYGTPHDDLDEVSDPAKLAGVSPEMAFLRRGGRLETIYDPVALDDHVKRQEIATFVEEGEIARLGPAPMKLMIFDEQELMMSVPKTFKNQNPDEVQALRSDHPSFVAIATALWEKCWKDSRRYPYGPDQSQGLVEVAQCQVSGLSVEQTMDQLRLSKSQVNRYRAKLRSMLGARNEAQLGWLLATRGLVGLEEPRD